MARVGLSSTRELDLVPGPRESESIAGSSDGSRDTGSPDFF